MDSTPTPSTPEPARGRKLIVTRLLNDPAIGSKLRADLKVARRDWPAYEEADEAGANMTGELIGARHKIIRQLAQGGMADVYLAKDLSRKCPVALKILWSRGSEAKRRFRMEGVLLSNLQHPGIVRAVDVGETPEGQPYMALEHLDGEPLSVRVARGPLPWRDVATFGIQVAGAERPQQAAADDVALDLRGTVPDPLDPGVAPEAGERQIVHQPHAAMDLDHLVGHMRQHLGGEHLGAGDLALGRQLLVEAPRGMQSEPIGRVDLGAGEGHEHRAAAVSPARQRHARPREPVPCTV